MFSGGRLGRSDKQNIGSWRGDLVVTDDGMNGCFDAVHQDFYSTVTCTRRRARHRHHHNVAAKQGHMRRCEIIDHWRRCEVLEREMRR